MSMRPLLLCGRRIALRRANDEREGSSDSFLYEQKKPRPRRELWTGAFAISSTALTQVSLPLKTSCGFRSCVYHTHSHFLCQPVLQIFSELLDICFLFCYADLDDRNLGAPSRVPGRLMLALVSFLFAQKLPGSNCSPKAPARILRNRQMHSAYVAGTRETILSFRNAGLAHRPYCSSQSFCADARQFRSSNVYPILIFSSSHAQHLTGSRPRSSRDRPYGPCGISGTCQEACKKKYRKCIAPVVPSESLSAFPSLPCVLPFFQISNTNAISNPLVSMKRRRRNRPIPPCLAFPDIAPADSMMPTVSPSFLVLRTASLLSLVISLALPSTDIHTLLFISPLPQEGARLLLLVAIAASSFPICIHPDSCVPVNRRRGEGLWMQARMFNAVCGALARSCARNVASFMKTGLSFPSASFRISSFSISGSPPRSRKFILNQILNRFGALPFRYRLPAGTEPIRKLFLKLFRLRLHYRNSVRRCHMLLLCHLFFLPDNALPDVSRSDANAESLAIRKLLLAVLRHMAASLPIHLHFCGAEESDIFGSQPDNY